MKILEKYRKLQPQSLKETVFPWLVFASSLRVLCFLWFRFFVGLLEIRSFFPERDY
jgi:hypothetical protein